VTPDDGPNVRFWIVTLTHKLEIGGASEFAEFFPRGINGATYVRKRTKNATAFEITLLVILKYFCA